VNKLTSLLPVVVLLFERKEMGVEVWTLWETAFSAVFHGVHTLFCSRVSSS